MSTSSRVQSPIGCEPLASSKPPSGSGRPPARNAGSPSQPSAHHSPPTPVSAAGRRVAGPPTRTTSSPNRFGEDSILVWGGDLPDPGGRSSPVRCAWWVEAMAGCWTPQRGTRSSPNRFGEKHRPDSGSGTARSGWEKLPGPVRCGSGTPGGRRRDRVGAYGTRGRRQRLGALSRPRWESVRVHSGSRRDTLTGVADLDRSHDRRSSRYAGSRGRCVAGFSGAGGVTAE